MGQTLTHGIYLPDEGERNCYDGLASNWSILDGAVGTVAEHTSQIAGKAPAVHTHTKADITDFPAYGNTAGTICEGNDSRLSDARAPVAHTHTKSDVTDLLNSDFIPSADTAYNIGSAMYRWHSVWTGYFKSKSTNIDLTDSVTTENKENWYFTSYDKNENTFFSFSNQRNHSVGSNEEHFRLKNANGGWADFYLKLTDSGEFSVALSMHTSVTNKGFRGKFVPTEHLLPAANNAYGLGSSTYKWKTINGINPGALSFPNYSDNTYIDISGSIVPPTGETEINKNLGDNQYTPPIDGWLSIRCDGAKYLQIYRNSYNCPGVTSSDGVGAKLVVTLPVRKNVTYTIRIKKDSAGTEYYQLYPCLGNV